MPANIVEGLLAIVAYSLAVTQVGVRGVGAVSAASSFQLESRSEVFSCIFMLCFSLCFRESRIRLGADLPWLCTCVSRVVICGHGVNSATRIVICQICYIVRGF